MPATYITAHGNTIHPLSEARDQTCVLMDASQIRFHWTMTETPQQVFFFLLYSMVTQLHIHVHILFSHIIMLHHKWLDIAPSATQQDLIAIMDNFKLFTPCEYFGILGKKT